jgi:hypothetical protein
LQLQLEFHVDNYKWDISDVALGKLRWNRSNAYSRPRKGALAMRRGMALLAGLFLLPVAAAGQDAPTLGGLASQPGWAGFAIVDGRLAVLDAPPRFEKRTACADAEGQISESICIRSCGCVAAVQYEFVSPRERVTVEAVGNERVEIHRTPQEGLAPAEMHLHQAPGRELVLTIGAGDSRREYSAASFWHLMLAEPDAMRDCVTPLLEAFRPDWALWREAAGLEARLFELAAVAPAPDETHWNELVGELGAPLFARREAADRQLRAVGQSLVPFLAQLDRRQLDGEQRSRLAGIRRSLAEPAEDTPSRVARRMLYDQRTWLILISREDATQRALAATRLRQLCSEAVAFDPQAEQAVRSAQLQQLRQQLVHD